MQLFEFQSRVRTRKFGGYTKVRATVRADNIVRARITVLKAKSIPGMLRLDAMMSVQPVEA